MAGIDNTEKANVEIKWAEESESRLEAFKNGLIKAIPISEIFKEIERGRLE